MKHFRLLTVVVVAAMPACLVYDSDLLSQGEASGSSVPGDGDGDGDGDGGTGGVVLSGGGGGGPSGGGGTGGSGDGDGDGDGGGDGDGDTGGMGGDLGSGGATGGEASGGGPSGGAPNTAGSCPPYSGSKIITSDDLIDDMSLAANAILSIDGRKGDWLAFHGTSLETVPSPNSSGNWPTSPMEPVPETLADYALHYRATTVGADSAQLWQRFGFLLNEGSPYSLEGYAGVLFCARRDAALPQSLNLELTEGDPDPMNDVDYPLSGSVLPVTWGYIEIPFPASVSEALPGAKSIWFVAPGNGVEYDIWIDNIYLYRE